MQSTGPVSHQLRRIEIHNSRCTIHGLQIAVKGRRRRRRRKQRRQQQLRTIDVAKDDEEQCGEHSCRTAQDQRGRPGGKITGRGRDAQDNGILHVRHHQKQEGRGQRCRRSACNPEAKVPPVHESQGWLQQAARFRGLAVLGGSHLHMLIALRPTSLLRFFTCPCPIPIRMGNGRRTKTCNFMQ